MLIDKKILSNSEVRAVLTKAVGDLGPYEHVAPAKGASGIILNDLLPVFRRTEATAGGQLHQRGRPSTRRRRKLPGQELAFDIGGLINSFRSASPQRFNMALRTESRSRSTDGEVLAERLHRLTDLHADRGSFAAAIDRCATSIACREGRRE